MENTITITLTEEEFKMVANAIEKWQSRLEETHQNVRAQEHEDLYYKFIKEYFKQIKR